MSPIQQLHQEAMEIAQQAFSAQREGNTPRYLELTKQAFEKEKAAAWLLFDDFEAEPTRSVLFRSAAQLAFNCGMMRETEQLVSAALVGNPPDEIVLQLRALSRELLATIA